MKIAITGGHISPALAVIDKLKKNSDIVFIGRKYAYEGDKSESFEYKVCKKLAIPFYQINTGRLQRKFTRYTLASILKFPNGIIGAGMILKKARPDIVLTFGGYVGLPVSIVAFLLKIPVVIHEQTQKAGLTNTIISYFADKVCISFDSSKIYFQGGKTVLTGNPVRKEIFEVKEKFTIPKGYKVLYITGGSGGSHFINDKISKILPDLVKKYVVIHQTGNSSGFNDYEILGNTKKSLGELKNRYVLKKFISTDEIGWTYKSCDLVISRSGINTVCELLALQKKCLLIPLSHGQKGEQLDNAMLIKNLGLGEFMEQKDVSTSLLLTKIDEMMDKTMQVKKDGIKNYVIANADDNIINVLKSIYEKKKIEKKN